MLGDTCSTTLQNVSLQTRCLLSDLVTDLEQLHYILKQWHQYNSFNLRTSTCLHETAARITKYATGSGFIVAIEWHKAEMSAMGTEREKLC